MVVSFKSDGYVVKLLENDAKKQFSSISAVLRQIVYSHYGIDYIPPVKKTIPEQSSRDCALSGEASVKVPAL